MRERHLILVDGSNLIMRAAFGGEIEPERAVGTATGMLTRFARELGATHAVIAFDSPDVPSWRRELFPAYKAHRAGRDTGPWIRAAAEAWTAAGWQIVQAGRFEADDVLATIAVRAKGHTGVTVVSGDSDLLQLTSVGVPVARLVNGGALKVWREGEVCAHYGLWGADALADFKALAGEPGDNIPGPFGKCCEAKARKLLHVHRTLPLVIEAGVLTDEQRAIAERGYQLVQLRANVPLEPIEPAVCRVPARERAA